MIYKFVEIFVYLDKEMCVEMFIVVLFVKMENCLLIRKWIKCCGNSFLVF